MTILVLAGTSEAKDIASRLAALGIDAVASLAGATRSPAALDLPSRSGGFGGEDGFRAYVKEAGITAVIDATHPFAAQITNRTARICAEIGLPYLLVSRPEWTPQEGDNWTIISREEDAATIIPKGSTVFLGTGRQTLDRFAGLEGSRVICRQIDPPTAPFPFEGGEFLIGRPPFPVARELSLFTALGIEWIVVKNAGGVASATKLTAARELKIPVLMIKRPPVPNAQTVATADAAVVWAQAL
ncbi:cobalt-precorrin-6A reductase [bacterium]|nr:cobalt-precorrin-6A reductase [bacterium]